MIQRSLILSWSRPRPRRKRASQAAAMAAGSASATSCCFLSSSGSAVRAGTFSLTPTGRRSSRMSPSCCACARSFRHGRCAPQDPSAALSLSLSCRLGNWFRPTRFRREVDSGSARLPILQLSTAATARHADLWGARTGTDRAARCDGARARARPVPGRSAPPRLGGWSWLRYRRTASRNPVAPIV